MTVLALRSECVYTDTRNWILSKVLWQKKETPLSENSSVRNKYSPTRQKKLQRSHRANIAALFCKMNLCNHINALIGLMKNVHYTTSGTILRLKLTPQIPDSATVQCRWCIIKMILSWQISSLFARTIVPREAF